MRILTNNKGQVRLIEAFLATLLLIGCVAIIPAYTPKTPHHNLAQLAIEKLAVLDTNGQLAVLVDAKNWSTLKSCIDSAMPLTLWYNLTVFDRNMNALNPYPMCSSGPVSETIASVDYVSASPDSTYAVYVLRLQLSEVGSQ